LVGRKIARTGQHGLTLVELLVVIVILALASSVVLLTAPPTRPQVRDEAERFAARMQLALDHSITSTKPVRVKIDTSGYLFEALASAEAEKENSESELDEEEESGPEMSRWKAVADVPALARREFEKGVTVTPEIADAANDNARALGDGGGPEDESDEEKGAYAIPLDPLGSQMAFSLRFYSRDGVWTASVDAGGKVTVKEND